MSENKIFTRPLVLGVGAQKSGTTWLSTRLEQLTNICVPPLKELHYFDRYSEIPSIRPEYRNHHYKKLTNIIKDHNKLTPGNRKFLIQLVDRCTLQTDDDYILFLRRVAGSAPAIADITPEYASLPTEGFERIRQIAPNAIPVFMMRNPVDRIWSMAGHVAKHDNNPIPRQSLDSLVRFSRNNYIRSLTDYSKTVDALIAAFENPIIVFYEDIFKDEVTAKTFLTTIANRAGSQIKERTDNILDKVYTGSGDILQDSWKSALRAELDEIYQSIEQRCPKLPALWKK